MIIVVSSLALAACATLPVFQTGADPASSQAVRVARLIDQAVERGDPRLESVGAELTALERALLAQPQPMISPAASAPELPLPPPAPDFAGGRSVFHGVHIASYRRADLAYAGWQQYRSREQLAELHAVLTPVDLEGSGHWLRLTAGPFDTRAAADAVCDTIRAAGEWCAVTGFAGDPVPGP